MNPSILPRLGTTTDAALAVEAGVSPAYIQQLRVKRGIPAFCPRPDVARTHRRFRATDAEYAPVLAYAQAHGCDESTALRAIIAAAR